MLPIFWKNEINELELSRNCAEVVLEADEREGDVVSILTAVIRRVKARHFLMARLLLSSSYYGPQKDLEIMLSRMKRH
jgi:hypothetical protein